MARILRLSPLQRNTLACIALFIVTNVVVISQYWGPRSLALSLSFADSDSKDTENILFESDAEAGAEEDILNSPRILLVSALFALPTAASSSTLNTSYQYLERLPRFLGSITTDVYFYTTPDLAPAVRAARGSNSDSDLMVDTSFMSPFDIPPLKGRELVYSRMRRAARDTENLHKDAAIAQNSEVLALRNAKPFFLEHAIQSLRTTEDYDHDDEYDYVFWVDATSFTDEHLYTSWPDPARVEKVWREGSLLTGRPKEDLIFFPIHDAPPASMKDWTEDMGPIEANFSEGSFFGGSPDSVKWLSRTFYAFHDYFIQLGFSSALPRSQSPGHRMGTVNALMLVYPERFITVWTRDPRVRAASGRSEGVMGGLLNMNWGTRANRASAQGYLGKCGDERYYYRWWLAGRDTRGDIRSRWMGHQGSTKFTDDNGREHAAQTAWWKLMIPTRSMPCQLTRVSDVESILRRTFGEGWQAAIATVSKPSRTW